ncbi:MAG: hypothetical protein M1823_004573 [Watsoniomyces obsoletus]|nr:MAG: hypothetical protein M1823_004573 [Watsoniomyces obsoletus]
MKVTLLTSVLVASAYALAAPQESSPASSTMPSMSATTTAPLTPQQTCLARCNTGDVTCQAACGNVPSPNENAANQTTQCAANCKQGNGSPEDTDAYSRCVQSCISSLFFSSNSGVGTIMPSGTGTTMSAMATGTATTRAASASGSSATGSSASGSSSGTASRSGSGTATGAAATASSTGAAGKLQLGSSLAGAAGLLAAVIAL